ncbi:glycerophosphoryl diester phosphodiesterase membrane domain-containing protein [Microbacterium sp. 10M-3C3]|uniref:glycerophosphoryl diester phosphodiesterase membrane domain-containing protein n=1 Tax=Microbacterium sp. 10M-3C3 TaxID=2483401 RepID=UPI000F64000F|nr:glycerophosphoryl diester phosphodiesterase membrane domain-containing protein [Microbacterium sp. 10M-3C3]
MSAYPAWTPAPRPGIVPLHPFGFGTTLGRSFTALRQNPGVLLGFALGVQALAYVVVLVLVGAVAFATFSRLDTVPEGSDDFDAILAGSIAVTVVVGIVLSLAAGALTVIVQGVVVSEVSGAVLAERRTLGQTWRRVRPVAWRLLGWSALVLLAIVVVLGAVVAAVVALGFVAPPAAIGAAVLCVLGLIPLWYWLTTKLALVPAVLVMEHARIGQAVGRSWRLTRGRFWPVLGVLFIVSLTFSVLAQIVGVPLQFLSLGLGTVIAPTGDPDAGAVIAVIVVGLLTQIVTLLVQCVALVVQSTASALLYVDCRMRHEGLDLDLVAYVERRDAGAADLPDPYLAHIGRPAPPRFGWAPVPPGLAGPPSAPPAAAAPQPAPAAWPVTAPPSSPAPASSPTPPAPSPAPAPDATSWAPPPGSAAP